MRQVGWAIGQLSRGRCVAAKTREGLVYRRRLDYTVARESLMRGRRDGETRWWPLPAGGGRSLDCASKGTNLGVPGVFHLGWSALAALLARFDDLPLTLSYIQAPLQLLAHAGVLGVEAGREAGHADIVQVGAALARGPSGEGTGGVHDVVVG